MVYSWVALFGFLALGVFRYTHYAKSLFNFVCKAGIILNAESHLGNFIFLFLVLIVHHFVFKLYIFMFLERLIVVFVCHTVQGLKLGDNIMWVLFVYFAQRFGVLLILFIFRHSILKKKKRRTLFRIFLALYVQRTTPLLSLTLFAVSYYWSSLIKG